MELQPPIDQQVVTILSQWLESAVKFGCFIIPGHLLWKSGLGKIGQVQLFTNCPITKNATWKLLPSALVMPSLFLDLYHQGHRHHDRLRGPAKLRWFNRFVGETPPPPKKKIQECPLKRNHFRGKCHLPTSNFSGEMLVFQRGARNPSTRGRQFIPQVCRLSHMPKCRI